MGYLARLNLRSPEGGKPPALLALHRLWRAIDYFQGDVAQFEAWMAKTQVNEVQRERLRFLWSKRYPKPLVTIEREMPVSR